MKRFIVKNNQLYMAIKIEKLTLFLEDLDKESFTETIPGFMVMYDATNEPLTSYQPQMGVPHLFSLRKLKELFNVDLSEEEWHTINDSNPDIVFTLTATDNLPTIIVSGANIKEANGAFTSWQDAFDNVLKFSKIFGKDATV